MNRERLSQNARLPGGIDCFYDFPDDDPPDEDLHVHPGGFNVACAIAEMLNRAGYYCRRLEAEPESSIWRIDTRKADKEYNLYLNLFGELILSAEEAPKGCFAPPSRPKPPEELLRYLFAEMQQDPRFREIEWLSHRQDGEIIAPVGEPGPRALAEWERIQSR